MRVRVPNGNLCTAAKVLGIFTGIPSDSLEFLLYASSAAACRSLELGCSLRFTVFECTIVDLQLSKKTVYYFELGLNEVKQETQIKHETNVPSKCE